MFNCGKINENLTIVICVHQIIHYPRDAKVGCWSTLMDLAGRILGRAGTSQHPIPKPPRTTRDWRLRKKEEGREDRGPSPGGG